MIGQLIFAELPFACLGQPPYLELGWIKDCADRNVWQKQSVGQAHWSALASNDSKWGKKLSEGSKWTVMSDARVGWSQQEANDVNTVGCGYVPTNIGGKQ